jgi:hypothetical protein
LSLDDAMLSLSNSLITYSIEQASKEEILSEKIKIAQSLLTSEDERKLFISKKVEEFIQTNNRTRMFQMTQMRNYISDEQWDQLKIKLKSDHFKTDRESEIEELLQKFKLKKCEKYLEQNEEFLTEEEISKLKGSIQKMKEYESLLIAIHLSLSSAVNEKDQRLLEATLKECDKMKINDKLTLNLIKEAKSLLRKLKLGINDIDQRNDLFPPSPMPSQSDIDSSPSTPTSSKSSLTKSHPLILELYQTIQILIQYMKELKLIAGKWQIPTEYQKGRNIVKSIYLILSHQSKIGLFSRKHLWNIFIENPNPFLQKVISFELKISI